MRQKGTLEEFGRYPYRNEALGRKNTPEEELFLKERNVVKWKWTLDYSFFQIYLEKFKTIYIAHVIWSQLPSKHQYREIALIL